MPNVNVKLTDVNCRTAPNLTQSFLEYELNHKTLHLLSGRSLHSVGTIRAIEKFKISRAGGKSDIQKM